MGLSRKTSFNRVEINSTNSNTVSLPSRRMLSNWSSLGGISPLLLLRGFFSTAVRVGVASSRTRLLVTDVRSATVSEAEADVIDSGDGTFLKPMISGALFESAGGNSGFFFFPGPTVFAFSDTAVAAKAAMFTM